MQTGHSCGARVGCAAVILRVSALDGTVLSDFPLKQPVGPIEVHDVKTVCLGTREAFCRLYHDDEEVNYAWLSNKRGLIELNCVFLPLSASLTIIRVLQCHLRELFGVLGPSYKSLLSRMHLSVESDSAESTLAVYYDVKAFLTVSQPIDALLHCIQLLFGLQVFSAASPRRGMQSHRRLLEERLPSHSMIREFRPLFIDIFYIATCSPEVKSLKLGALPVLRDLTQTELDILEAFMERFVSA